MVDYDWSFVIFYVFLEFLALINNIIAHFKVWNVTYPSHWLRGSVWIQLIFAKNWKHCSKIIFKYVNSVLGPFLMKKLLKSGVCGTYEQCTGALFMGEYVKSWGQKKKKRKTRNSENAEVRSWTQTDTKITITWFFFFFFFCEKKLL